MYIVCVLTWEAQKMRSAHKFRRLKIGQNYSAVCTNERDHRGTARFERPTQQATEP